MALKRIAATLGLGLVLAGLASEALARAPRTAELPTARPSGVEAAGPETRAATPRAAVAQSLAEAARRAARLSGRAGYVLMDLQTGEVLARIEAEAAFPPASVAKAPTALYALETLGPEHRFETRLMVEGLGPDGMADRVALVGGGDPELDSDMLADMAAEAFARGLRGAHAFVWDLGGRVEVPAIDAEQPVEVAYNPAVSPLTLNFNRVLLRWTRNGDGWMLNVEARARSESPPAGSVTARLSGREAPVFDRDDTSDQEVWKVNPKALRKNGQRWLPVRRPGAYAAAVFRALAAEKGVTLPQPSAGRAGPGEALAIMRSRPLSDILRAMLRHSTNLTAEAAGLAASAARLETPESLAESGAAMSAWATARAAAHAQRAKPSTIPRAAGSGFSDEARPGLAAGIAASLLAGSAAAAGTADGSDAAAAGAAAFASRGPVAAMDLRNHSGLSAASRASPLSVARLLRAAALRGEGRGSPGALQALMRPMKLDARKGESDLPKGVEAVAKTGTMNFVRGLAGYLTAGSGRRLVFAIFAEDLASRAAMRSGRATQGSRGWLGRARTMERAMVRGWGAAL